MPHRPGNPNWETGRLIEIPWLATAFEEQVQKLGLNERTCATSQQLE
jgi:hypothetical protein